MPALRPSLRRSTRLRGKCHKRMSELATTVPANTGRNPPLFPANILNPPLTGAKRDVRTTVPPPQPPPAPKPASQPKRSRKSAQNSSDDSQGVYWERYPYLTEKLLSWLWDNPADRAVLFNEMRDPNTQQVGSKPHGKRKKDINAAIALYIFQQDAIYGQMYANCAEKFTLAVGSRLAT